MNFPRKKGRRIYYPLDDDKTEEWKNKKYVAKVEGTKTYHTYSQLDLTKSRVRAARCLQLP